MSICQYLASEVHEPHTNEPKHREIPRKLTPAKKLPVTVTPPTPAVPDTPPPSRIVVQLMEMGFPRRRIEYAVQVS